LPLTLSFFLSHDNISRTPKDGKITYAQVVIDHRPQKDDPNRVHITIGANFNDYTYEIMTQTANLVSSKTMWDSVINTPNAKFDGADIKNMYLKTPLDLYEFMKMPLQLFPKDIIKHYRICEKSADGYAFMEIRKGVYSLPQASILANKLLKLCLACHGYFKQPHMPGLSKHVSQPIWFNLCMDNFGIKYIGDKHFKHFFCHLDWIV
jgi:hypothetical protein